MLQKCGLLFVLVCASVSAVVGQTVAATGQPGNCLLTVPAQAMTAQGLATPWLVTNCVQQPMLPNQGTATFVQATILDLDTGNMFTYTPLILSAAAPNNQAAIAPTVPVLPPNNVMGFYGGTNGLTVTLQGVLTTDVTTGNQENSMLQANCINGGGTPASDFGQFFCCNCQEFLNAAYNLIRSGFITFAPARTAYAANQIPMLATDDTGILNANGQPNPCPTTHSFGIVDQDQSDNVPAKYLFVTANGNLAQSTIPNKATLTAKKMAFVEFDCGSDEQLVTLVQAGLGCPVFVLTDLADATGKTTFPTGLSNELQALTLQGAPKAFIPAADPMVVNGGNQDVNKVNAYRVAVGQTPLTNVAQASTVVYCTNLYAVGAPLIASYAAKLQMVPAPDFGLGVSTSLAGLLVGRYGATVGNGNLNCPAVLGIPNPLSKFTVNQISINGQPPIPGNLTCPAPFFNPMSCAFLGTKNGLKQNLASVATALGISNLAPDMTGQTTVDIPFPPGSAVNV